MSSSSSSSSLAFQPTCPSGSTFYTCTTGTKFIGCCTITTQTSNPCTTGCAATNLKPASFFADAFGSFPDQECPSGSLWYTCKSTKPPFWGCCKVNACASGCTGVGNLSAAYLSSDPSIAAAFLVGTTVVTSSSSTTAVTRSSIAGNTFSPSASASSSSSLANTTNSPTTITSNSSKKTTSNIGAVVGGTVAGVPIIVLILLVLFFFIYRRRKAAAATPVNAAASSAAAAGAASNTVSISHQQQSPLDSQRMVGNDQNTHPALRHPETSAVAAGVEQGFERSLFPNMEEPKSGAYARSPPPLRPPPPPSYTISEIDGTPLLSSSSSFSPSPPPTFNTFPHTRAYSAPFMEIPSPEIATRAEMEGDSPISSPLAAGARIEEMKEKKKGAGSPLLERVRAGTGEGGEFGR